MVGHSKFGLLLLIFAHFSVPSATSIRPVVRLVLLASSSVPGPVLRMLTGCTLYELHFGASARRVLHLRSVVSSAAPFPLISAT